MIWVGKALVLAIHERQLAEHGGTGGLRDEGLLESVLARLRGGWPAALRNFPHPSSLSPHPCSLAAALAYGLARNHPFLDGNKRTAAVACETFLELNGATLGASDPELYPVYLALAEGKLSERDFAAWLRERVRTRGRGKAREPRAAYRAKPRTGQSRRGRAGAAR